MSESTLSLVRNDLRLQPLKPFVHDALGYLTLHARRRRSGPGAVFEAECRGVTHLVDDPQRRLEIFVTLAREADDEIA